MNTPVYYGVAADYSPDKVKNALVQTVVPVLESSGGISGNRSVDLYARVKADCWNLKPDVVSVLIGINDVYPQELENNGVELDRYEKIYRMLIEDTKAHLPNVKMILCEPFMLPESANENDIIKWTCNPGVREYAATVRKLAKEYGLTFVALQEKLEEMAAGHADCYVFDGIHPTPAGAKIIANEWLKVFERVQK